MREVLVWRSIRDKKPKVVTGQQPFVRFILSDGSEVDVVHEGDHVEIRNAPMGIKIKPRGARKV